MNWEKPLESQKSSSSWMPKGSSKQKWAVLLLVGLILAVCALPVEKKEKQSVSSSVYSFSEQKEEAGLTETEAKLKRLLESISGVGRVEVMIYASSPSFSSLEESGKVTGVLVVAQGADNPQTVLKIQEAVMSLFQIDAHKMKVMKMK